MFDKVYVLYVFLASNEWGNDTMHKVASEILNDPQYADKKPFIVMIHEHAGWYLGFTMIGGEVTSVYSANDAAVYHGAKKDFRDKAFNAKWKQVGPEVRREPQ
jgi:hypothetical protein